MYPLEPNARRFPSLDSGKTRSLETPRYIAPSKGIDSAPLVPDETQGDQGHGRKRVKQVCSTGIREGPER